MSEENTCCWPSTSLEPFHRAQKLDLDDHATLLMSALAALIDSTSDCASCFQGVLRCLQLSVLRRAGAGRHSRWKDDSGASASLSRMQKAD